MGKSELKTIHSQTCQKKRINLRLKNNRKESQTINRNKWLVLLVLIYQNTKEA